MGNFFVGIVHYGKRTRRKEYEEKLVLYTEDGYNYIDLRDESVYTINISDKDYVISESLIPTDISEYREDYSYLLKKYKEEKIVKKRRLLDIK